MDQRDRLADRFETHRPRLRAVASRLLGSRREEPLEAHLPEETATGQDGPDPERLSRLQVALLDR